MRESGKYDVVLSALLSHVAANSYNYTITTPTTTTHNTGKRENDEDGDDEIMRMTCLL